MAAGSSQESSGPGLSSRQQERIEQAIDTTRRENGLDLSVVVGDLELDDLGQFSAAAGRLHAALGQRSSTAVLLVVAPGQRRLELVTGAGVRRRVPDRVCALAVLSMSTAFAGGDVTGGIVDAIRQIADAAGRREAGSPVEEKTAELVRSNEGVAGSGRAPAAGAGHDERQTPASS